MEIVPGLHRLESYIGDKLVAHHLITGDRSVLLDAGTPALAEHVVIPWLTAVLGSPARLDTIMITHANVDGRVVCAGTLEVDQLAIQLGDLPVGLALARRAHRVVDETPYQAAGSWTGARVKWERLVLACRWTVVEGRTS